MFTSSRTLGDFLADPRFTRYQRLRRSRIAKRVFDELRRHVNTLADVALEGPAPLNKFMPKLKEFVGRSKIPSRFGQFLTSSIEYLLAEFEIEPFDADVPVRGPKWAGKKTTNFYRRSECILKDELDIDYPILFVVSSEEQRVARAIFDWVHRSGQALKIYVWTLASGLFEAEVDERGIMSLVRRSEIESTQQKEKRDQATAEIEEKIENMEIHLKEMSDEEKAKIENEEELEGIIHIITIEGEEIPVLLKEFGRNSLGDIVVPVYIFSKYLKRNDGFVQKLEKTLREPISDFLRNVMAGHDDPTRSVSDVARHIAIALGGDSEGPSTNTAQEPFSTAVGRILYGPDDGIFIFTDIDHHLVDDQSVNRAMNIRALRDAFYVIRHKGMNKRIILLGQDLDLPPNLRRLVHRVEVPLPQRRELSVALRQLLNEHGVEPINGQEPASAVEAILPQVIDAALGMTMLQVELLIERISAQQTPLPTNLPQQLVHAKQLTVRASGVLEIIREMPDHKAGGLGGLMEWLRARHAVFKDSDGARRHGIDRMPRGVLLLGISGTGKSLACKLIAEKWKVPLLRLDAGAIYNMYVGSSEARIREALRVAETISPCVLWVDEIEKGFGQRQNIDGGTSARVLGTFLTWMQEHGKPVFTVATANDMSALPPEMMRAGRFDNRFFLSCPDDAARREIFTIHLRKRLKYPDVFDIDVDSLVEKTLGFTGAEIEQVVLDALYDSFSSREKITQKHLDKFAQQTRPLIATVGKNMDSLWELIESGRVELASKQMLTRSQLMQIIDPYHYFPMYCREATIRGYEHEAQLAERIGSSDATYGRSIVVFNLDDPDWIYGQCNFKYSPEDNGTFKFLDKIETIKDNDILFRLDGEYALETILFRSEKLLEDFREDEVLGDLRDLFVLMPGAEKAKREE